MFHALLIHLVSISGLFLKVVWLCWTSYFWCLLILRGNHLYLCIFFKVRTEGERPFSTTENASFLYVQRYFDTHTPTHKQTHTFKWLITILVRVNAFCCNKTFCMHLICTLFITFSDAKSIHCASFDESKVCVLLKCRVEYRHKIDEEGVVSVDTLFVS